MRPEPFFGFDPAPGSTVQAVALADALRKVARSLAEARTALEALSRSGGWIWSGPEPSGVPGGEVAAEPVLRYLHRIVALEEPLVACLQAVDSWHEGLGDRQGQVAELVERYADLAGQAGVEARRARLAASAEELREEHSRARGQLAKRFAELSAVVAELRRHDDDLAGDLDRALLTLSADVDAWLEHEASALLRTSTSLGEVALLTSVISELVGVAAVDRSPGETTGVAAMVARSPGSHRLIRALGHPWEQVSPDTLPMASFAVQRSSALALALAGELDEPDESAAETAARHGIARQRESDR